MVSTAYKKNINAESVSYRSFGVYDDSLKHLIHVLSLLSNIGLFIVQINDGHYFVIFPILTYDIYSFFQEFAEEILSMFTVRTMGKKHHFLNQFGPVPLLA